jgi:translation initiation factor IF-2
LLYGFGEIIDKLSDIEQNTRGGQSKTQIEETAKRAQKEAAEKSKREAEERAKREAEERAKREAEEKAKHEAERAKRAAFAREMGNIEYLDITCPNCHEKLSFEKGASKVQCPFCDFEFNIDE